jgi:hypothetical protein
MRLRLTKAKEAVMRKQKQELTTLTFKGPSFEDHGLELDVLFELVQYKRILLETAEESLRIKFYELRAGSTAVPLYREFEFADDHPAFDFPLEDELSQAVDLVESGMEAAEEDRPLPDAFPKNVLPLFDYFGRTLGDRDFIQVKSPKRERPARFTSEVRERLMGLEDRTYEDSVELTGEVRLADLDGLNFVIRLDDKTKIPGKFEPEHEPKIIEALKDHTTCRLKIKGLGQFSQRDAALKKVVQIAEIEVKPADALGYDDRAKPIWELVAEIGSQVPEKEWKKVPSDLSKELDHYLYGSPRSDQ